jgi:hypothetical protein
MGVGEGVSRELEGKKVKKLKPVTWVQRGGSRVLERGWGEVRVGGWEKSSWGGAVLGAEGPPGEGEAS